MRWERSKPLWPIMVALGLLFMLALVAPRNWQNGKPRRLKSDVQRPDDLPDEPIVGRRQSAQPELSQTESLPMRREFDLEALRSVRDLVLSLVDQLPETALESTPSTKTYPVRVSSEQDRLAMVPRRASTNIQQTSPTVAPGKSLGETTDFAAILLEAASLPQDIESVREAEPILAMKPQPTTAPQPVPTEPLPAKPQLAEPQLAEPQLAELQFAKPQSVESPQRELPVIEPPPLQHRPAALIEQLENFDADSAGAAWSQQVLVQLRLLTEKTVGKQPAIEVTLNQLEQLYESGTRQAESATGPVYHNRWRQAAQALGRRLILWRILLDPDQPKIVGGESYNAEAMLPVLDEIADLLKVHENGDDWRTYLLLDRIFNATSEGINSPVLTRAKLAQEVLSRMSDPRLTEAQRVFLTAESLTQLRQMLGPWAAAKANLDTLAALVERYESGRETRYAAVINQLQQRLKWSEDLRYQGLANHLAAHYRGANLRIAMNDVLLNRMLPKQEPIITPVRDRIAGAKVFGRARTTTQLRVKLLSDPAAWHFGLEAFGKVYSDTRSDTWPARIRNAAKMQYQASKEISLSENGLRVAPARATAQGRNELLGVDSQLDPIPIVGFLLRDMARQKHKKSRPVALTQAKAKVIRQAKERMDSTLAKKIDVWEEKFREKILTPIEELALLAEPLDMHTTEERAVMQLRLANAQQLAAHTLRPLAPSDSVLSLQMHESALNNAMTGLGLDGRRMTMLDLFDFFTQRFGRTDGEPPEDLPRKAVIEFASSDAVRVQCDGDRLELILSVVELAHRRDKIKNFQIHVHFRPEVRGLDIRLVRDGTLQFSGRRLKTGPRVVLHSIIGKLLAKDHEIKLLNAKVQEDPRLAGLMVTQLVLEDGWIGLALGPAHPRRTAWRTPLPKVLSTPYLR